MFQANAKLKLSNWTYLGSPLANFRSIKHPYFEFPHSVRLITSRPHRHWKKHSQSTDEPNIKPETIERQNTCAPSREDRTVDVIEAAVGGQHFNQGQIVLPAGLLHERRAEDHHRRADLVQQHPAEPRVRRIRHPPWIRRRLIGEELFRQIRNRREQRTRAGSLAELTRFLHTRGCCRLQ